MFRDFVSFAVGAFVALISVMPYEKCMKPLYTLITRMNRLSQMEVRTGLDVDWIEETQAWTNLQKECARTAARTCRQMVVVGVAKEKKVDENNCKPLLKVVKQFEKNPDLHQNPYDLLNKATDKQALSSVMEARNADRTSQQVAAALSKHFPSEPVGTDSETRPIPRSLNRASLHDRNVFGIVRPLQTTEQITSEMKRRADLVVTPDVADRTREAPTTIEPAQLERLLNEVAGELDENGGNVTQNEQHSTEVVASSL